MSYTPNPQMVADLQEEIRLRGIASKAMTEYKSQVRKLEAEEDHRLKTIRRMQTVMSRTAGMGGMIGGAMNMVQGIGGLKKSNQQRFNQLKTEETQRILSPKEAKERDMLGQNKGSNKFFDKLDAMMEKSFGGDSKWNKMFGGQGKMAAAGIGAGAVGAGIGLGKMIIDSSPAFQSLLKLLNFGIMLILRPIGDFFALLFRPILIMLLRKFIIPFYQYVYPWFMKNLQLGESITGSLDEVASVVQSTATTAVATSGTSLTDNVIKTVTSVVPPANLMTPPPKGNLITPPPKVNLAKTGNAFTEAALTTVKKINQLSSLPFKIVEKAVNKVIVPAAKTTLTTSKVIATATADMLTGGAATKVLDSASKAVDNVTKPLQNIGGKVLEKAIEKGSILATSKVVTKVIPVVGQVLTAIDASGSLMKEFAPEAYEGIRQGALGIGAMLGDDKGTYTEGFLDFMGYGKESTAEQLTGLAGGVSDWATGHNPRDKKTEGAFGWGGFFGMAEGGMIKEPIKGVGKSGQKYMFGESGMEAVMPMRKIAAVAGGMMGGIKAKKMDESRSQSPITINITVNGSIHSDRDMLNFQRTIMKAIETSSTRKSRL